MRDLSADQDTTDLEKALAVTREKGCEQVFVTGRFAGVSGRLDHTFGIANSIYLNSYLKVAVVGDDSLMILLSPGEHTIVVSEAATAPYCGLIPIGEPCESISTSGLKYNMSDTDMRFGGLISTCNQVDPSSGGLVWVKTSSHVLWICTLVSL